MTRPFDVVAHEGEGELACKHCAEFYPRSALDRHLWCPPCRTQLERQAKRGQHLIAALITLPFLIWIVVEGTEGVLPSYAWILPLLAAYYLGSRIGRVLIRGFMRAKRGP
jgi:uncharacterized protein YbaR (Trm112 family)